MNYNEQEIPRGSYRSLIYLIQHFGTFNKKFFGPQAENN